MVMVIDEWMMVISCMVIDEELSRQSIKKYISSLMVQPVMIPVLHGVAMLVVQSIMEAIIFTWPRDPIKRLRWNHVPSILLRKMPRVFVTHKHDALVVIMKIANHKVHHMLVDTGNSANIIYFSAFCQWKLVEISWSLLPHLWLGSQVRASYQKWWLTFLL